MTSEGLERGREQFAMLPVPGLRTPVAASQAAQGELQACAGRESACVSTLACCLLQWHVILGSEPPR